MRSKKPLIVALFLCGWTIIIYLIWMRQSVDFDTSHKHMLKKLNYLEESIKEESDIHEDLVQKLVNVIKLRNQQFLATISTKSSSVPNNGADERVKEILLDSHNNLLKPNLSSIFYNSKQHADTFTGPIIPILVFACNRISVSKCLDNLVEYRPNRHQFPIIVSQVILFTCFLVRSLQLNLYQQLIETIL